MSYLSEDRWALLGFQSAVDREALTVNQTGEEFSGIRTNAGLMRGSEPERGREPHQESGAPCSLLGVYPRGGNHNLLWKRWETHKRHGLLFQLYGNVSFLNFLFS